jgi:hypothetical protein
MNNAATSDTLHEVQPYVALALQTPCHAINRAPDTATAREWMRSNILRVGQQIHASKQFIGPEVRLGDPLPVWAERAAWHPEGPEYAAVAQMAVKSQVFISGNCYELDAHFPGFYFQTSFIVDDTGKTVLRYRRLISMFAPTPHDVWDRYLEIYGLEASSP